MSTTIQRRSLPAGDSLNFSPTLDATLQRIYAGRGLRDDSDLDLSLSALLPPSSLKGLEAAVDRLVVAVESSSRILLVGDFDADGATSCALAIRAFIAMGHSDVQFMVPNRFEYGYGLTPEIVALAQQQKRELIITVDNVISSVDGVATARAAGIDVLVTDHHLPGRQLPEACAIVNPNQRGCEFSSKALAGVGVIFYVMSSLRAALRQRGWFVGDRREPNMADFLDLVALGTVADVVPLDKNNRILVEQGLRRIRSGKACAGIRALIEVAGRSAATLSSSDIAFALAPRLNAAGRLDDMSIGIACLLSNDESMSRELAAELDAINKDRRQIEQGMQQQAEKVLQGLMDDEEEALPTGVCLFDKSWHQGVVGILASRIKQRHHRPVICFAPASEGDDFRDLMGSARSIPGFHIRDALDSIATSNPGLIDKFGGHAMAAGLSLQVEALEEFSRCFDAEAKRQLSPQDLSAVILSDGELPLQAMRLECVRELVYAMPWGQLFPEPLFDGEFLLLQQKVLADRHLKLLLQCVDSEECFDAIAFNIETEHWPDTAVARVAIAYRLDINCYRGRESVQLVIESIEKVGR